MIYERHLTPSQTRAFKLTAGSDVRNFHDGYAGSLKRADILLTPRPDEQEDDNNDDMDDVSEVDVAATLPNGGFPTVAVEVGFSQSYDSLLRDMRLWLEGSDGNVRVVILVNLIETPQVNLQPLVHDQTRTRKRLIYESRFGPVHYKSHRVVGDITGTLELWRLDPVTKLPVVKLRKVVSLVLMVILCALLTYCRLSYLHHWPLFCLKKTDLRSQCSIFSAPLTGFPRSANRMR